MSRASSGVLSAFNRVLIVTLSTISISLACPLSAAAQRDVHAQLVARSDRKAAPNFQLASADGRVLRLSEFKGKVVLINFWATSCGGCVLEIPSFIELQSKHQNTDFTAIGISADIPYEGLKTSDEAWQRIRPFIAEHKVNYPIVLGNNEVIDAYGFKAYPATYLIDKSGRVAATYIGIVSKDDVEGNIQKLVAE